MEGISQEWSKSLREAGTESVPHRTRPLHAELDGLSGSEPQLAASADVFGSWGLHLNAQQEDPRKWRGWGCALAAPFLLVQQHLFTLYLLSLLHRVSRSSPAQFTLQEKMLSLQVILVYRGLCLAFPIAPHRQAVWAQSWKISLGPTLFFPRNKAKQGKLSV